MTPIEPEDKQNSIEWREKTWNFPLDSDDLIRFFDKGNYTLRVDVDAKKHVLVNFQVVNSTENEFEIIDDFDKTWGGPGNRHPAFWGFDIPEICTEEMIKHLVRYSTMFDRNAPYSLEWISFGDGINQDDFDRCVEELLEKNPKDIEDKNMQCEYGFKAVDGVCKQLGKIREKDIPIFFEIRLMELGIEWELADRIWTNTDFEIEPPARICSHIIQNEDDAELYISTIWQDEYSLSEFVIQKDMPDDCVKFLPVTQIGRK